METNSFKSTIDDITLRQDAIDALNSAHSVSIDALEDQLEQRRLEVEQQLHEIDSKVTRLRKAVICLSIGISCALITLSVCLFCIS